MTEPREIAPSAREVIPGLWHWSIHNSNIGGHISSSQAVLTREGCVLVDPVRLDEAALGALPRPIAVLLTARCHQRAAWRYRRDLGAEVWLPEDATAADEEPDHTYADGQVLPGGLRAFRTPGPEWPHYSFLYEADPGVVFCSDLLSSDEAGLHFINPAYHEDPAATRASVEHLLELQFGVICFAHGTPVTDDPKAALQAVLTADA
jgi:glyoxylase-like metal-dependent hydrolase (beta-lactamase superfamily II)